MRWADFNQQTPSKRPNASANCLHPLSPENPIFLLPSEAVRPTLIQDTPTNAAWLAPVFSVLLVFHLSPPRKLSRKLSTFLILKVNTFYFYSELASTILHLHIKLCLLLRHPAFLQLSFAHLQLITILISLPQHTLSYPPFWRSRWKSTS